MSDFIIVNGELYHYGVKGMKWGKRRAQRKEDRINKKLSKKKTEYETNESNRKADKLDVDKRYSGKKAAKKKARIDAEYDYNKLEIEYRTAKLKAKKDPNYKKSEEFATVKRRYKTGATMEYALGKSGSIRYNELKNRGYTSEGAATRVRCENALNTIGTAVVISAATRAVHKAINK